MRLFVTLILGFLVALPVVALATPETEKAFIDSYKTAFEKKDEATLKSFLYTQGSDPQALEFYTMMMTGEMGGKISSIELKDLTPEDQKKATEIMPTPDGGKVMLNLVPIKKLMLKIEMSDANGSSSSTSETFVALHGDKFVIPVPGPVK